MRKVELLERLSNCVPILKRSGIEDTEKIFDDLQRLDGVGVSRHVSWLKKIEKTCIHEGEVYKDMSPTAWVNICMINPGSEDVRRLRGLRRGVKDAWKARPRSASDATK